MSRCNKCNIEKSRDQYQTYWHSTQQKYRIRRICRDCISLQQRQYKQRVSKQKIIQPEVPELQPEPIEVDTLEQWMEFDNGIEYQHTFKSDVYHLLKAMGWNYNYNEKFWWKPSYRLKDGNFTFKTSEPKPEYLSIETKPIRKSKKSPEIIQRILNLRNKGWSYQKIADQYGLDDNTIRKWIISYYEEKKSN